MATENKPKSSASVTTNSKKRKQRYLPHNKPVKKKGSYPLHPGVQGFFITCDGGREHQASREAINVIDSFYEELVLGKDSGVNLAELLDKPINKKIKFSYSDDEGDNDEDKDEEDGLDENKTGASEAIDAKNENPADEKLGSPCLENEKSECQTEERLIKKIELPAKKKCTETCAPKSVAQEKVEEKSIDKLIEDELKELGDKNKRRFLSLDSGCNGVIFVQMRKIDGDPCPKDIVQHMMTSAASTRKHMSRFILRVLPIEVACYASEEEISRAIAPVVEKYFPVDTQDPQKFAVMYEARANSGIDRMKIINSVAKSVPGPHKVDLSNPDKTIVVEIVKTLCLIGVIEKYKELSKYNLRQLTSSEQK
ncbi:THUMP domain-containing family protein [Salix suchowensis]|nr:THUMP domain-containing family protein [Salix suchowensis]